MQVTRLDSRLFEIETQRKVMRTPFYFPAISSVKTKHNIEDYLKLIDKINYPGFLVSSYDIFHAEEKRRDKLIGAVSDATEGETITFLDSGNYEASWYEDEEWSLKNLESVLDRTSADFCFSFDVFWGSQKGRDQHVKATITAIAETVGIQKMGTIVPLVHADSVNLPEITREVVEGINPRIIGVPERELGPGIFQRADTIKRIKSELDETGRQIPLHVLGTGDPISILVYALCGADMFDGLEWCRKAVDPNTASLRHFSHLDMIECSCSACVQRDMGYDAKTMAHNLVFYERFTEEIRKSIEENAVGEVLAKYMPSGLAERVMTIAGF